MGRESLYTRTAACLKVRIAWENIGNFMGNKKQGAGIWILHDGVKVEGNWISNHLQSGGKVRYPDGTMKAFTIEGGKVKVVGGVAIKSL